MVKQEIFTHKDILLNRLNFLSSTESKALGIYSAHHALSVCTAIPRSKEAL